MDQLITSLQESPIVNKGDYEYVVHPVTDGIPVVRPSLLTEIVVEIQARADMDTVDKIVAPEAMGIHLATALSLESGVPFVVVRKRSYGLENEREVDQETAYGGSKLYLNGIDPGDRVLVIDDMLSSGGTLQAICSTLLDVGAEIAEVIVVLKRGDGIEDMPVRVESLVEIRVEDGRLRVH